MQHLNDKNNLFYLESLRTRFKEHRNVLYSTKICFLKGQSNFI